MGTRYHFSCDRCKYEAMVSGGNDMGLTFRSTTIICQDCKLLFDVTTSDQLNNDSTDQSELVLVCPGPSSAVSGDFKTVEEYFQTFAATEESGERSNSHHRVCKWKHPGPCPKCGQELIRGKLVMNWD